MTSTEIPQGSRTVGAVIQDTYIQDCGWKKLTDLKRIDHWNGNDITREDFMTQ